MPELQLKVDGITINDIDMRTLQPLSDSTMAEVANNLLFGYVDSGLSPSRRLLDRVFGEGTSQRGSEFTRAVAAGYAGSRSLLANYAFGQLVEFRNGGTDMDEQVSEHLAITPNELGAHAAGWGAVAAYVRSMYGLVPEDYDAARRLTNTLLVFPSQRDALEGVLVHPEFAPYTADSVHELVTDAALMALRSRGGMDAYERLHYNARLFATMPVQ